MQVLTIIGHSQDGDLSDGAIPALHTTSTLLKWPASNNQRLSNQTSYMVAKSVVFRLGYVHSVNVFVTYAEKFTECKIIAHVQCVVQNLSVSSKAS